MMTSRQKKLARIAEKAKNRTERVSRLPIKLGDGSLLPAEEAEAARRLEASAAAAARGTFRPYDMLTAASTQANGKGKRSGEAMGDDEDDDGAAGAGGEASKPSAAPRKPAAPAVQPPMSHATWKAMPSHKRRHRFEKLRQEVASLSRRILGAPEKTVVVTSAAAKAAAAAAGGSAAAQQRARRDLLSQLHELCGDADPRIRKLAMLSEMAVLKDILPGYRVRTGAEAGGGEGVTQKKETKRLQRFEQALLAAYARFLRYLRVSIDTADRQESRAARGKGDAVAQVEDKEAAAAREEQQQAELKKLPFQQRQIAKRKLERQVKAGTQVYQAPVAVLVDLRRAAARCLCECVRSCHHFNFRDDVIKQTVRLSSCRDATVAELVGAAVKDLLETDTTSGAATLVCVEAAAKLVKQRGAKVNPELIAAFARLPLHWLVRDDRKQRTAKAIAAGMAGRRQRKLASDELSLELRAADAEDRDEKRRCYTAALAAIFHVYFRLLRLQNNSRVLPAILAGLGRFSHLVDVGVVEDLIVSLRDVIKHAQRSGDEDEDEADQDTWAIARAVAERNRSLEAIVDAGSGRRRRRGKGAAAARLSEGILTAAEGFGVSLPLAAALQLTTAALAILRGPGRTLNMDDGDFGAFLYQNLLRLVVDGHAQSDELVLEALKAVRSLLITKSEPDLERCAAFVKRLLVLALHLPTGAAGACLLLVRDLFARYPSLKQLLDSEADRAGSGVFAVDAPRLRQGASPMSVGSWELFLLSHATHRGLRGLAKALATNHKPGLLPGRSGEDLVRDWGRHDRAVPTEAARPQPTPRLDQYAQLLQEARRMLEAATEGGAGAAAGAEAQRGSRGGKAARSKAGNKGRKGDAAAASPAPLAPPRAPPAAVAAGADAVEEAARAASRAAALTLPRDDATPAELAGLGSDAASLCQRLPSEAVPDWRVSKDGVAVPAPVTGAVDLAAVRHEERLVAAMASPQLATTPCAQGADQAWDEDLWAPVAAWPLQPIEAEELALAARLMSVEGVQEVVEPLPVGSGQKPARKCRPATRAAPAMPSAPAAMEAATARPGQKRGRRRYFVLGRQVSEAVWRKQRAR